MITKMNGGTMASRAEVLLENACFMYGKRKRVSAAALKSVWYFIL